MKIQSVNSLEMKYILYKGLPAIFPTDTLPALGIIPKFSQKLWDIKKRPLDKPLILMASTKDKLLEFILPIAVQDASDMAQKYWPGPLTMVLPAAGNDVSLLNKKSNTIGIRIPENQLAMELLSQTGPLATTSANLSGEEPVMTEEEAFEKFPELSLLGPMPWPKPSGIASTVIEWKGPGDWKILRRGAVIPEVIGK